MGRLFGTDGVRGIAGSELSSDLAGRLGRAAVDVLTEEARHRPVLVVGRDPRASGVWLEEALVEGVLAAGGDVLLAGVQPTPAVAFLTIEAGADAGVMISASHNPPEYNGIKIFGPNGMKLPDTIEDRIEAALSDAASDLDGDVRELEGEGAVRGGERSGHVISGQHATPGEGLLTAVRFLSLAASSGRTVAD